MKEKLKYMAPAALAIGATTLPVWASDGGSTSVTSAMSTAISTIASDALSGLGTIIPVAAPIMGGLIVIGVAIKTFRKFTKG